ncbi:MAG: four helix bundle protein [Arachidicoccus sp.]|nr:four helix bundle protein [Arachidicoccus sp.]
MRSDKENLIVKLSFEFAKEIIFFTEKLQESKKFVIANQLIKSGTSIGANIREAQNAESKIDFIHKFKIAAKEIDETEYWLLLCKDCYELKMCDELLERLSAINRVVSKIISTSKEKQ